MRIKLKSSLFWQQNCHCFILQSVAKIAAGIKHFFLKFSLNSFVSVFLFNFDRSLVKFANKKNNRFVEIKNAGQNPKTISGKGLRSQPKSAR